MLVSHVLVPPAMTAVLQSPGNRVRGFLGPGHVCTVMGYREYEPIAAHYRVPIVITGFEPLEWKATRNRPMQFCTCKRTKSPPFCDDSHKSL